MLWKRFGLLHHHQPRRSWKRLERIGRCFAARWRRSEWLPNRTGLTCLFHRGLRVRRASDFRRNFHTRVNAHNRFDVRKRCKRRPEFTADRTPWIGLSQAKAATQNDTHSQQQKPVLHVARVPPSERHQQARGTKEKKMARRFRRRRSSTPQPRGHCLGTRGAREGHAQSKHDAPLRASPRDHESTRPSSSRSLRVRTRSTS